MPDSARSRPLSTSTTSSLLQDVPGAFPAPPQSMLEDDEGDWQDGTYQSLPQAVYARRAEYLRTQHVRIKVGTWNVAAIKGTEKDVAGWFVGGQGVAEGLAGLHINSDDDREGVAEQEARYEHKQQTLPQKDPGTLPSGGNVGIYVLGLQEIVDVGSATEALRPYTDPTAANKWKNAVGAALPTGYQLVAEQQLIGMLLLVYAAPDLISEIKSVSTTSVGTGLMGYMGNKGAVTARLVLGETTRLVFVNCHLAAGADKAALERRNWDVQQILSRTRFEPIRDAMDLAQTTGEQIGEEDVSFWCGDLNYRLEGIPGDDVRRLLMLHTRNEYDISQEAARKIENEIQQATNSVKERVGQENSSGTASPIPSARYSAENIRPTTLVDQIEASEDPTSLQTTLSSLLPHDELHQQMYARKAFYDGWQEGAISFLPTYKYDPGSVGVFDSSEKKRAPSWCDRILYRTRKGMLAYESKIREEENARKKDAEMEANGIDQGASDEEILYDYDPDTDGAKPGDESNEYDEYNDAEDGVLVTKEGAEDELRLEYYVAHQRVLSSDHKPLDATFLLRYEAVVPELKAQVYAEVAKDFDKAENEGRPNVTIVVDGHNDAPETTEDSRAEKFEGVWFGDVKWAHTKHRSLTIANTSRVPASFAFIERPVQEGQGAGPAPKWLSIKMHDQAKGGDKDCGDTVTLEPGETCNVELELRIVSMDEVKHLNADNENIEDILVLRVENGRDHFIPVRAHWLESSLGRSIDKLVRIPEGGIRKLQRQKPEAKAKAAASTIIAASALKDVSNKGEERPGSSENIEDPVRFSAPRELFRLTEAVEELYTRIVAEWEMINTPSTPGLPPEQFPSELRESAPWDKHPAWPFDEASWTERSTFHWTAALSEACNALDEDTPLEPALAADLPRMQKLYVLCSLLLLFVASITDGIVTTALWLEIEKYISDLEKVKQRPSIPDQRAAIQEILSRSPPHNISFILIMGMLERMMQERSSNFPAQNTFGHSRSSSKDYVDIPLSPAKRASGTLKRMVTGLGPLPPIDTRNKQEKDHVASALAKAFADALVQAPPATGEKSKAMQLRRKRELIEIFLMRDRPAGQ